MHDILEGCIPFELKLLVNSIVDAKLISLTDLNQRIKLYHYGVLHQPVKPSPIVLNKTGNSIGQRAMQSWCLFKFFPFLINDLTLSADIADKFEVVLILLQIMLIIFSPRISEEMVNSLETLVETHHSLFKQAFKVPLIPKMHFMIHCGRVIRQMGPLVDYGRCGIKVNTDF